MAIRQRLYPTQDQQDVLVMHCAHARFVWNLALEQANMFSRDKADRGVSMPNTAERMRQLAQARAAFDWLGAGSSVVQQGALRDFDRAQANWWSNPGHFRRPTWRKAGVHEGFIVRDVTVHQLNRKWATIVVPKAGPVRFRLTRPWAKARAATSARVTYRHGQWHVSLTTAPPVRVKDTRPDTGAVVGIDRGVANSIATSDGQFSHAPGLSSGEQARFLVLQRRLARQTKGSNRRARTKTQLGRLHGRLAQRRTDWVEQNTTALARDYDLTVLEALNTTGMTKAPRPKPDPDTPGAFLPNGARAKASLNKAILASAWGRFATRLGHKTDVVFVDPKNTSRQCNHCGHTSKGNRQSQAVFTCTQCGHSAHADTNAACNILGRALTTPAGSPPATTGATGVSGRAGRERTHQPHPAMSVPRQPQPAPT